MIIQHNIPAENSFRNMAVNNKGTAKALEKLSSGFRINIAGDDAAGLAISEKMRAQVKGLNRASANSQDGVSLIQSADGALQEVHAILHRMRELSIQAANDVNQQVDRQAIQNEIDQLVKEVDRISATTEFNKMTVLDGSLSRGKYVKSVSGSNVSGVALIDQHSAIDGLTSIAVVGGTKFDCNFDMSFPLNNEPYSSMGVVQLPGTILNIEIGDDIALAAGLQTPAEYAVAVNVGESAAVIAGNVRDALSAALGHDWSVTATGPSLRVAHNLVGEFDPGIKITADPMDIWEPGEWDTSDMPADNVSGTQGSDVLVLIDGEEADFSRINAHDWDNEPEPGHLRGRDTLLNLVVGDDPEEAHRNQFTFKIDDATRNSGAIIATRNGRELTLQVGANTGYEQTVRISVGGLGAKALGISELRMFTHQEAQNGLASIDIAVQMVSDQRAELGAVQNRLEHTIANVDTVAENLQDAESRLRDADMAKEMMAFTKFSILHQSSQAMLAQSMNIPQGVLQLLR